MMSSHVHKGLEQLTLVPGQRTIVYGYFLMVKCQRWPISEVGTVCNIISPVICLQLRSHARHPCCQMNVGMLLTWPSDCNAVYVH
jgi:hypothetical protein